jgi:TrmH family RNA methyltransferase
MSDPIDFSTLVPAGLQNPRVAQYLGIKKNTKSNPENLACLEGLWELTQALEAGLELRAFFVCPELLRGDAGQHAAQRIVATGVHSYLVSAKVMERLVDRDTPDGLAAIARLPQSEWANIPLRANNRLLILDGLEIPGNVGTIIRCADGAGADAVVITSRRTRLSHPKLIHSSMGSSFTLPVIETEIDEAVAWLKAHQFRIITTDSAAPLSYRKGNYRGRVAVVMGSERYGIMRAWYDAQDSSVSIPMSGTVDSLNVGNAAVLLLYEVFVQQEPGKF